MDTLSTVLLPDFGGERSWRRAGPVLLPRADLPACPPASSRRQDWRASRVTVAIGGLTGAVSLQIPSGWTQSYPQSGVHSDPTSWIVGLWNAWEPGPSHLSITVSPNGGYSSFGADSATRQVGLAECEMNGPRGPAAVVTYEAVKSQERIRHVDAVLPAGPSTWLRVHASTPTALDGGTLHAIVASVRIDEP